MSARPRDAGIVIGVLTPGPANAITDVGGVAVGHVTVVRDEEAPPAGRGVARTGVTVVVPAAVETLFRRPVPAATAVLNGAGELSGSVAIREWGVIETPIYLTATMSVGRVLDGAVTAALSADPAVGVEDVVIPVVGECDDSTLNDARTVQVEAADAGHALAAAAGGPVAEGAVGAGTGMIAFGYKAGIGTASRRLPDLGAMLGVLVLANFGTRDQLIVAGVPVGRRLGGPASGARPGGSCIAVVAIDAPLSTHQLARVARRAGLGLARAGSVGHHGSGEIFAAFATEGRVERHATGVAPRPAVADSMLNEVFAATVEATEEAVVNSLWAAGEMVGRDGHRCPAMPHDEVLRLLREAGALA